MVCFISICLGDTSDLLTGDLVYIKVFGQGMVFVNSAEVAYDMFEKASSIYSDRSESPMLNDLYVPLPSLLNSMYPRLNAHGLRMGFDWHITFMRYGEWWRRHRKLFHQKFHPTASTEYYPIQIRQTQCAILTLRLFMQ